MGIKTEGLQSIISDDFLHLAAEVLRNEQSSEGALRSAISRAYYSTFLAARDKLFGPDGSGLTNQKRKRLAQKFRQTHKWDPGSHDIVIFAIADIVMPSRSPTILRPLVLSQQLSQLKEARVHADYHFTQDNLNTIPANSWRDYAKESVALASQILPTVRKLPSY